MREPLEWCDTAMQGDVEIGRRQRAAAARLGQASHQRQNTEQLLASTEANLQQIAGRNLNATQQETVGQIRNYIVEAHSALKDGDTQRAHRLADKAQQLADDLVKH